MRPDSWPSVADPPAEVLYREAAEAGHQAAWWMKHQAMVEFGGCAQLAAEWAIKAAGLYHEAQRVSGICPEHASWPCEVCR